VKRTPLRRRMPLRPRSTLRPSAPAHASAALASSSSAPGRLNGPVGTPRRRVRRSRSRGTAGASGRRLTLVWVKRQPCLMRGVWGTCESWVEADHAGRRGAGRKAHDSTCIPLCKRHHHASRFPRAWPQAQRRAWLHAAVVYTQACARAAGVQVPVDVARLTEYRATWPDIAWAALAEVVSAARGACSAVRCAGGATT
jgi:hypothetical protein